MSDCRKPCGCPPKYSCPKCLRAPTPPPAQGEALRDDRYITRHFFEQEWLPLLAAEKSRADRAERERGEAHAFATEVREALGGDYAGPEAHWRARSLGSIRRLRGSAEAAEARADALERERDEARVKCNANYDAYRLAFERVQNLESEVARLTGELRRTREWADAHLVGKGDAHVLLYRILDRALAPPPRAPAATPAAQPAAEEE